MIDNLVVNLPSINERGTALVVHLVLDDSRQLGSEIRNPIILRVRTESPMPYKLSDCYRTFTERGTRAWYTRVLDGFELRAAHRVR
jgi:hypothetical protein